MFELFQIYISLHVVVMITYPSVDIMFCLWMLYSYRAIKDIFNALNAALKDLTVDEISLF